MSEVRRAERPPVQLARQSPQVVGLVAGLILGGKRNRGRGQNASRFQAATSAQRFDEREHVRCRRHNPCPGNFRVRRDVKDLGPQFFKLVRIERPRCPVAHDDRHHTGGQVLAHPERAVSHIQRREDLPRQNVAEAGITGVTAPHRLGQHRMSQRRTIAHPFTGRCARGRAACGLDHHGKVALGCCRHREQSAVQPTGVG